MEEIISIAFKPRPQAVSFEGANPRHEHEWEVFKDVKLPDDKIIIPGVLDSTTNYIEHPRLIAQRIVRCAELVGKENVIADSDWVSAHSAEPATPWSQRLSGQNSGLCQREPSLPVNNFRAKTGGNPV